MKIVTPILQIDDNDGFKNDLFGREVFGEALKTLILNSTDNSLVISIDGTWGEGKTTFIKMWQGLLRESSIPFIYIDAFANDYTDDAFITVASAITNYVEKHIGKSQEQKVSEFKIKAKKVGVQALSFSAKLTARILTLGVIRNSDIEELQEISKDLAKDTSSWVEDLIEERIKSHSKDIEIIESFKELLSDISAHLSVCDVSTHLSDSKPLIIIIDELDRCKPIFSVDLLEKIKHLFSVKNVVFILSMNKEQLEESIKCVYGQNIDAHAYLQKFIDIETVIPKKIGSKYESGDLNKYSEKLAKLHGLDTKTYSRNLMNCINIFANHFNPSLRQIEKIYTNLTIFYASTTPNTLGIEMLLLIVFLVFVKVINPQIFKQLNNKNISHKEVSRILNLESLYEEEELWIKNAMSLIPYTLLTQEEYSERFDEELWNDYSRLTRNFHINKEDLIPYFIQRMNFFKHY